MLANERYMYLYSYVHHKRARSELAMLKDTVLSCYNTAKPLYNIVTYHYNKILTNHIDKSAVFLGCWGQRRLVWFAETIQWKDFGFIQTDF